MSRTCVEVAAGPPGARPTVRVRGPGPDGRGHLGVRVLSCAAGRVRLALVAEGAMLLAGDDVGTEVHVGPGLHVEVVETTGTVAYAMRGGRARWSTRLVVSGSEVVWRGEPFVVADGADVERSSTLELTAGARLALRDSLVLGRHGEPGGRLRQRTVANLDGAPALVEDLELDGARPDVAVLGTHRVVDTVLVLGCRAPDADRLGVARAQRMDLAAEGTLVRVLADDLAGSPLHALDLEGIARPEPLEA